MVVTENVRESAVVAFGRKRAATKEYDSFVCPHVAVGGVLGCDVVAKGYGQHGSLHSQNSQNVHKSAACLRVLILMGGLLLDCPPSGPRKLNRHPPRSSER